MAGQLPQPHSAHDVAHPRWRPRQAAIGEKQVQVDAEAATATLARKEATLKQQELADEHERQLRQVAESMEEYRRSVDAASAKEASALRVQLVAAEADAERMQEELRRLQVAAQQGILQVRAEVEQEKVVLRLRLEEDSRRLSEEVAASRRAMEERHRDDLETLERARAALVGDHTRELQQLGDEQAAVALQHERDLNELHAEADARADKLREEMALLAAAVNQVWLS